MGFIWFYGYPRRSRTHPLSSSQWCGPCPLLPFLLEWHSLQRWMVEKEKLKHVPDECDFKVLQLNSGCCSFCHVSSCMWATKLNAIILSFARCTYLSLYLLVIPVFWTASPSPFGEPGLTDSLLWRDALTSGCPSAVHEEWCWTAYVKAMPFPFPLQNGRGGQVMTGWPFSIKPIIVLIEGTVKPFYILHDLLLQVQHFIL